MTEIEKYKIWFRQTQRYTEGKLPNEPWPYPESFKIPEENKRLLIEEMRVAFENKEFSENPFCYCEQENK